MSLNYCRRQQAFNREIEITFDDLSLDVIEYISRCFKDLRTLNQFMKVCKRITNHLSTEGVMNKWKRYFEEFYLAKKANEIYEKMEKEEILKILDFIKKHKAVISGSFPLKFLSNANYHCGDLDIFIPITIPKGKQISDYEEEEIEERKEELIEELMDLELFCEVKDKEIDIDYSLSTKLAKRVISVLDSPLKVRSDSKELDRITMVQVILLTKTPEESIEEIIEETFDITFCIASFDGEHIKTNRLFEQITRIGYMRMQYFENMTDTERVEECGRVMKRTQKYLKRGFRIFEGSFNGDEYSYQERCECCNELKEYCYSGVNNI